MNDPVDPIAPRFYPISGHIYAQPPRCGPELLHFVKASTLRKAAKTEGKRAQKSTSHSEHEVISTSDHHHNRSNSTASASSSTSPDTSNSPDTVFPTTAPTQLPYIPDHPEEFVDDAENEKLRTFMKKMGIMYVPQTDESTVKREESPATTESGETTSSSDNPPTSSSTTTSIWADNDTNFTAAYMAQLSLETENAEVSTRWKDLLVKHCRWLEGMNEDLRRKVAERDVELRECREQLRRGKGVDGGVGACEEEDDEGYLAVDVAGVLKKIDMKVKVSELTENEQIILATEIQGSSINKRSGQQRTDDDFTGASESDEGSMGSDVDEVEGDGDEEVTDEDETSSQKETQRSFSPFHHSQSSYDFTSDRVESPSECDDVEWSDLEDEE
ncbi:hypothetical protein HDV00_011860 [Rhizophlyctis rosea]|nr:hypothetical protein HDV00_011860 [Rhizophlyctis rosea]